MRCGCDVVQVSRIAGLLERREGALARLFSAGEVADACRGGVTLDSPVALRRLAARWAAKEATVKALQRTTLGPRDIEVRTLPSGAPELWVHGRPTDLAVSLSHDGDVAMAFVVAPDPLRETPDPLRETPDPLREQGSHPDEHLRSHERTDAAHAAR